MARIYTKCLLIMMCIAYAVNASAYDFEAGGLCYNITSDVKHTVAVAPSLNNTYAGSINIPATVVFSEEDYAVTKIAESAFKNCKITAISVPSSVEVIENYAFNGCSSLISLSIEDGTTVLTLGCNYESQFSDFDFYAGNGLFYDCPLQNIYIGRNLKYDTNSKYGYSPFALKSSSLSTALKTLTIGTNVTEIGDYAFYLRNGMKSLTLPDNIKKIGEHAFSFWSTLKSISLPKYLTSLGEYALCGTGLIEVTIPENIKELSPGLLYSCGTLTTVTMPDGITSIGTWAFMQCGALSNITLSKNVTSYGATAFGYCTSLKTFIIGKNMESIGVRCFAGCTGISKIICLANTPPSIVEGTISTDNAFSDIKDNCKIYVPNMTTYLNSDWNDYYTKDKLTEMVHFSAYAFNYSGKSPNVQFTNGITDLELTMPTTDLPKDAGTYDYVFKAKYTGELNFDVDIPYSYTIRKATLAVTVTNTSREYGDPNPKFNYTIEGFKNNETIADIFGTEDIISTTANEASDAGTYPLSVNGTAKNYNVTFTNGELTVTKAPLGVAAVNSTKVYLDKIEPFTLEYSGLKNGDKYPKMTSPFTITCDATYKSDVGTYPITVSGGESNNYFLSSYTAGTLEITKAQQTIDWTQNLQDIQTDGKVELLAKASSGLDISYSLSDNEIAEIVSANGKQYVKGLKNGTATITASQEGNNNYMAAERVSNTVTINVPSGIDGTSASDLRVTAGNYQITVVGAKPSSNIYIFNAAGNLIELKKVTDGKTIIPVTNHGLYMVKINGVTFKVTI